MASSSTTLFVNETNDVVKMKVGSRQYWSEVASIEGGGNYRMHVNMNDTYREFLVGIGSEARNEAIVSSDDCCDYQCITIKEVNGQIDLDRQPRQSSTSSSTTAAAAKKPWFTWKMWV